MNKLFAEFLGTFLFCTVALLSSTVLASAGALAALVYGLAYVSGGHLNPAVSIAVWLRGQMDRKEMLRYAGVQCLGAVAAVILVWILSSKDASALRGLASVFRGEFPWFRALIGETVFTFLVAFTYLHVRTARQVLGNTWFGIAIAWAYLAGASVMAPISGGMCNPALGLAAVLQGIVPAYMILIYGLAGLLGGAAASVSYRVMNPND